MGSVGGGALQAVGTKTQEVVAQVEDIQFMTHITGTTPTAIPLGTVLASPEILARWKITKPAGFSSPSNYRYVTGYRTISAQGRVISGAGTLILAVATSSDDGATWGVVTSLGFSTGSFLAFSDNDATQQNITDLTDFAVIGYFTNGTTAGEFRGLSEMMSVIIPSDFVITKTT